MQCICTVSRRTAVCQIDTNSTCSIGIADCIDTRTTVKSIVSAVTFNRIVISRSGHVFKTADRIVTDSGLLCYSRFKINLNCILGMFKTECIGTCTALQHIITRTPFDRIVTRFTVKRIVSIVAA